MSVTVHLVSILSDSSFFVTLDVIIISFSYF